MRVVEITSADGKTSWREYYSDMSGWSSLDVKKHESLGRKVGLVVLKRDPITGKQYEKIVYKK